MVHFRLATHGRIDARNCHPWAVGPGLCVAHNGILPYRSTDRTSDTGMYVRDVLRPNARLIFDPYFRADVEDEIGRGNKFVFLNSAGEWVIYNESAGVWRDGCWLSNTRFSLTSGPADDDREWHGRRAETRERADVGEFGLW